MLIECIIELRGPGPPGFCSYALITGYFNDKTKIPKESLRLDYYLLLKYCKRQCFLLSPAWVKSLTKFNAKNARF